MLPLLACALLLAVDPSEVEPNDTRDTATPVTLSAAAPAFTGVSRGSATTGAAELTRDYWRITLTVNPLVVYKHTLSVSTTGTSGHTGSIAGHQRTGDADAGGGVITPGVEDHASIAIIQSTTISTTPPRTNVFYSLGQPAPWLLYRVVGGPSTTSPYTVTLASIPVTPTVITCPFAAGPITITTVAQGHSTNTEVFLFDADTLQPVPDGFNDDTPPGPSLPGGSAQSTLTRTLPAGRYLLAIGNFETADSRPPAPDDRARFAPVNYLADSPGLLINSASAAAADFTFSIADAYPSVPYHQRRITASKPGAYGLSFHTFTVVAHQPCGRADVGAQGGILCWDGRLDNNDFIVFINAFLTRAPAADVGVQGGTRGSDNLFNNEDFIVYINLFFNGCNAF